MCCKCQKKNFVNCACSIFQVNCRNQECCWCCFCEFWEQQQKQFDFYNKLFTTMLQLFKTQKHLKTLKKMFKNLMFEVEEIQTKFKKLSSIDFGHYLDNNDQDERIILDELEQNLSYKIRCQISEWELIIEICLVLLDLESSYFDIGVYDNMKHLSVSISHGLYFITKIFTTITRSEFNSILYNSTKEKIFDVEAILSIFETKLAIKIQKN